MLVYVPGGRPLRFRRLSVSAPIAGGDCDVTEESDVEPSRDGLVPTSPLPRALPLGRPLGLPLPALAGFFNLFFRR